MVIVVAPAATCTLERVLEPVIEAGLDFVLDAVLDFVLDAVPDFVLDTDLDVARSDGKMLYTRLLAGWNNMSLKEEFTH